MRDKRRHALRVEELEPRVALSPVIIDDLQPGYSETGTWTTGTGQPHYGPDFRYTAAGAGENTATWQAQSLASGKYDVQMTWSAWSNQATNAPFKIYDGTTLLATVAINQKVDPLGIMVSNSVFQSLGTYSITSGTVKVVLSNNANGYVIADALRVADPTTLDLNWTGGSLTGPATTDTQSTFTISRTYNVSGGPVPADFAIGYYASLDTNIADGTLLGRETITSSADKTTGLHAGTSQAFQLSNGGKYYLFARLDDGNAITETDKTNNVAQTAQQSSVATVTPYILDNGQFGYSDTGAWMTGAGQPHYGPDFRYSAAGAGENTATWRVGGLSSGAYNVQVTWSAWSNQATNAPYQIYDGTTLLATVTVNQKIDPVGTTISGSVFQSLGTYSITSGTLKVVLSNNANGYVIADALRVEVLTPYILDNSQNGYSDTGAWVTGTGQPHYGSYFRYSAAGAGENTATWRISGLASAIYDVQMTWSAWPNQATNAPYQIYDGTILLATVTVSQKVDPLGITVSGSVFQSLGTYKITSGTLKVVLSNNANGYVIANALRVAPPVATTLDLNWTGGSITGPATTDTQSTFTISRTYNVNGGPVPADFTIGYYASLDTNIADAILLGRETITASADKSNGAHAGKSPAFQLSNGGNYYLFARLDDGNALAETDKTNNVAQTAQQTSVGLVTPYVLDNGQFGYSETGTWVTATGQGHYGPDLRYSAGGAGENTATWQVGGLASGIYDVQMTWSAWSNQATNAPYQIYDGTNLLATVAVSQKVDPVGITVSGSVFQSLGWYSITSGTLKVVLSNNANGYVIADALRLMSDASNGLVIPQAHARIWWNAQRLTEAKQWYAAHPFTPASDDPLNDALAYVLTGNQTYAQQAITQLMAWTISSSELAGVASDTYRWGQWVPIVYDWCYNAMTASQQQTFMTRYNGYTDIIMQKPWGGPTMPASNYFWGYLSNEFNWALATYYENSSAQTYLNDVLVTRWKNSFLPYVTSRDGRGGVAMEGSQYGPYMLHYPMVALTTAALMGDDLFQQTNFYKEALFQSIYSTTPALTGGYYQVFPFGDDENYQAADNVDLVDFMTAAAEEWSTVPAGQYARQWLNMLQPSSTDKYVAATDPGGTALSFTSLPTDYYAPGAQYLYTRDQWGPQGASLVLQMGQPHGGAHTHPDAGSFQIWNNGQWLSRESVGYSTAFSGGGGSNYTQAVNGILFNGLGSTISNPAAGEPQTLRLQSTPTYSYAAVDITPAYQSTDSSSNPYVVHVEREYLFIKPLKTLVVLDRLLSTSATDTKTFLLHFPNSPTINGNTITGINGNQALIDTSLTAGATYNVVNEGPNGQYRLEENVSGAPQSYMLNVIQAKDFGKTNVAVSMTEDANSWTINLDSAALGHAVVVLQKGQTTSGGSIGYSATGVPTSTTPLLDHVQRIQVTNAGPVWGS